MVGSHNPDNLTSFVLRIPMPLKNMIKLYAHTRHLSINAAMRELMETHPAMTALYRSLTHEDQD